MRELITSVFVTTQQKKNKKVLGELFFIIFKIASYLKAAVIEV